MSTPATSTTRLGPGQQTARGLSKPLVIFTFLLGIFMGALDHGIVGPALSSIMAAYQLNSSWGVWSFTIYTLLFAVSIPVLGKLSDRFGRKQIFTFGISTFAIGSVIAALAPNFIVFLLGRAVQAIGTGGIFPITAAQIAVSYPPDKRGKAMALIGVFFGIGTILGPVLGGVIIAFMQWQWIFLINVPISLIILAMISRFRSEQQTVQKPIDMAGIVLLTLLILSLMLGITQANVWYLLAAAVLLPVFLLIERKHQDPVMNLSYFTRARTLTLLLASLLSGFVMATATNLLPLYGETLLGLTKGNSGLTVAPMAVSSMIASLIAGYMVDKMGPRRVLLLGFAVSLVGAGSLAFAATSVASFVLTIIVMGFGVGIIIGAPLNMMILQAVEPKETGSAVGYLSLFRSVGSTLGPTIAGPMIASMAQGFAGLYSISAAASIASIAIILIFVKKKVS
jgi:EmrB/QacA subfamily drug resistance transporter